MVLAQILEENLEGQAQLRLTTTEHTCAMGRECRRQPWLCQGRSRNIPMQKAGRKSLPEQGTHQQCACLLSSTQTLVYGGALVQSGRHSATLHSACSFVRPYTLIKPSTHILPCRQLHSTRTPTENHHYIQSNPPPPK